jgi:hypothetical protein
MGSSTGIPPKPDISALLPTMLHFKALRLAASGPGHASDNIAPFLDPDPFIAFTLQIKCEYEILAEVNFVVPSISG